MTLLKRSVRLIYPLLAMLTVADAALFVYVTVTRHSLALSPAVFLRNPADSLPSAPPRGYSAQGIEAASPSPAGQGWAVRYTTPACPASHADEKQWGSLKAQLLSRGYRIYTIPPNTDLPAHARPSTDETQLMFVDVGWMRRYRLPGTPTLLLFNGRGQLIWTHAGTISHDDAKSALSAVFWNNEKGWWL